jgi:DNA-binding beta-propeller fold protein YncE
MLMSSESPKNPAAQPNDPPEAAGATVPGSQNAGMTRRGFIGVTGAVAGAAAVGAVATGFPSPSLIGRAAAEGNKVGFGRYIYAASPGIEADVAYGGEGILVFDTQKNYQFVKRIQTFPPPIGPVVPEQVTGVCASAQLGLVYVCTTAKSQAPANGMIGAFDLKTDKLVWQFTLDSGVDRQQITPDGLVPDDQMEIWVPSFRLGFWNVLNAVTGQVKAQVTVTTRGAHNTCMSLDGKTCYLASLNDPFLHKVDTATRLQDIAIGPFSAPVRPFTINAAQTLVYVNVNNLLGFGIGDARTGQVLYEIPVVGYPNTGRTKRHGTVSHGIGITPDGSEIWLCDGLNSLLHIFDNTVFPPVQKPEVIALRDQPGWVSFSLDGQFAYPSTGEIINIKTRKIVAALTDELGRQVGSEKLLEVDFRGNSNQPYMASNSFGIGPIPVVG